MSPGELRSCSLWLFMVVCVCVCTQFFLEGMNSNEIFYGPVDLLIVPQVLSLLTTHFYFSKATLWAQLFLV